MKKMKVAAAVIGTLAVAAAAAPAASAAPLPLGQLTDGLGGLTNHSAKAPGANGPTTSGLGGLATSGLGGLGGPYQRV